MTHHLRILALAAPAFLAPWLYGQPVVTPGGVVNAASYMPAGLPSAGIARGALFVVFGQGLGPAGLQQIQAFPLPTTLAGTSIRVTVAGTSTDAIMIYTSAGQVAAVLPSETPAGNGTLTVTFNGQTSAPVDVQVVENSFGVFTRNQAGSGPAIIQNYQSATMLPVNALTESANPGQVVIVWGTGLGAVEGNEAAGPLPGATINANVEILLGGRAIQPYGFSRSGCCAGLDQISFTVPEDMAGCYVPLAVKVSGIVSNYTTLSIAPEGRTCSDPVNYSADQIERIATGGDFRTGVVMLTRTGLKITDPSLPEPFEMTTDSGFGAFQRYTPVQLESSQGYPSTGACVVYTFRGAEDPGDFDPIEPVDLDAGPVLTLTGPRGTRTLEKIAGVYIATLGGGLPIPGLPGGGEPYLDPGTYTITNGGGGADVGGFTANLTLPALLTWANQDAVQEVPRNQGLQITWTGGDQANEVVMITGGSVNPQAEVGASFTCVERANAGSFTVPADVLSILPASGVGENGATGMLTVGSMPIRDSTFQASGLDAAYFLYFAATSQTVSYR